jgi:hypothetical protein
MLMWLEQDILALPWLHRWAPETFVLFSICNVIHVATVFAIVHVNNVKLRK